MSVPSETFPTLVGDRLTLRPGVPGDVPALRRIQSEPSVMRWWGEPEQPDDIAANLAGTGWSCALVIEVDGEVAGGIEYSEEDAAAYRHAGIDIYLGSVWQRRGLGREAIRLLARFLIDDRGHHRLSIDPAAENASAIRCYEAVGFRRVGVLREYERGLDGTFHDGLLMDLLAGELR